MLFAFGPCWAPAQGRMIIISCLLLSIFIISLPQISYAQTTGKPNIIFILGDDVGYGIPTVNGGQSYSTPNIDSMARNGMNFTHCEASPLCSPSRFMLLTGKYNFRNYSIWGLMNNGEKTIGNVMKDAGYSTGFFGKMQLYDQDSDMLNQGFEKYLVLENLTIPGALMRYKNPRLYQNGMQLLPDSVITGKYADDILTQAVFNFIDSNKAIGKPFFAYYPMSLAHSPYSPTPDDSAFATWNAANDVGDTTYFPSMIKYMDKKIGQIIAKLKADGLDNNTIIIFSGDNGTPSDITSVIDSANAEGGKASTTEAGTHVPLMIYWPGHITPAINNDLISYVDFMPTLADAAGVSNLSVYGGSDGVSFYQRLLGNTGNPRNWIFNHFDEYPGFYTDTLSRWVQNATYKLYDTTGSYYSGKFFNITTDVNQLNPLPDNTLTPDELAIKNQFLSVLDTMPKPPPFPVLDSNYAIATSGSVTVGATIISNGGSAIKERGSCAWYYPFEAYYDDKLMKDSVAGMGAFQMYRTDNYVPQKRFVYSLYAMNNNKSNSTGWIKGSFMTLSKAPIKQPTSFTAKAAGCYVVLNWSSASWPGYGANKAGYLIVYSTGTPGLVSNPNAKAPGNVIANGNIAPVPESALPAGPKLADTLTTLSRDSAYNFIIVPYTWDGSNDSTFDYLAAGALQAVSSIAINPDSACPEANTGDLKINVFPNPSQSQFTLVINHGALNHPVSISVFDVSGKPVFQLSNVTGNTVYFGNNLAAGVYFVKVQEDTDIQTIKIIKGN